MFCSKCGKEITSGDKFCPVCGAENSNYKVTVSSALSSGISVDKKKTSKKHNNVAITAVAAVIIAIIVGALFVYNRINPTTPALKELEKNELKKTYYPMLTCEGDAYFYINEEPIVLKGDYESGDASPDGNKFVLSKDDKVAYYSSKDADPKALSGRWSSAVFNDGCFLTNGSAGEYNTLYYSYDTGETIDLGFDATFSSNNRVAVGITEEGELKKYTAGDTEVETLGTINKKAEICGISDSGEFIIWYTEDDGVSVFMMVNGVPERIGKLGKVAEYGYARCIFFNDGKQFIVYYSDNSTLLYYQGQDNIQTLSLPNSGEITKIKDQNGDTIVYDDAKVSELYIISYNKSKTATLSRMQLDGTIEVVVSDIGMKEYSCYNPIIKDEFIIYVDKNKDLCRKKIKDVDDQSAKILTTEVDDIYPTYYDAYVYFTKDNSLYSLDLNDDDVKLNLIAQKLGDEYSIYTTEDDSTIFYLANEKEIKDTYRTEGTLFMYTIGDEEPIQLAEKVSSVYSNQRIMGGEYITTNPIIEIHKSHHKNEDDIIVWKGEIGIINDSKYVQLIDDVAI